MTTVRTASPALLNELVALLRLTRTEAQVARIRVSQARRDDVRRELQDNAAEADRRSARLQATLRRLGGTPDVLADTVGRVAALTKATAEQVQPFSEGLLSDLALEQHLRDRVLFTRVLAEAQDVTEVVELMTELEGAHSETIEWIRVRLAELAQGGPVALAPTPTQAAVSAVARLATLPSRQGAAVINKAADLLQQTRASARQVASDVVRTSRGATEATVEVATAGRDAAVKRAEEVAPSEDVRKAAHQVREDLGTVDAEDLPVARYDTLSAAAASKAVGGLDDADDIRTLLAFEQAHKDRKGVAETAHKRLTELAEASVTA